jgi:hypothetical protein
MYKIEKEKTIKSDDYTINIRKGTYGPDHDPYAFEEFDVILSNKKVTCHDGMCYILTINDDRKNDQRFLRYDEYRQMVVSEIGFDPFDIIAQEDDLNRKPCKCEEKGNEPDFEWTDGFPGEHFLQCKICHEIVDSEFCRSEIE